MSEPVPDVSARFYGSIFIVTPHSDVAQEWIDLHIPDDAQSWCGGIVVEPRYVDDILDGMRADGLQVVMN